MHPNQISDFFHTLAKLAVEETLPYFRQQNLVDNKLDEGFDPVTEADRNTELAIRNAIQEHWPDYGIIGEEFDTHQPDAEYRWIIDPIDGTRAFITGLPLWGTLVALYKGDVPMAGMMFQPFTGETFISVDGASTLSHNGTKAPLATSSTGSLDNAILMCTSTEMFNADELDTFNTLRSQCKMTRFGGDCYAYCMLAAGQIDLVVESDLNLYDIAALIPIIEGAGGIVTDWQGQKNPQGGQIIAAANSELHKKALSTLQGN